MPVARTKEIWLLISMTIKAVMLRAGTKIEAENTNLANDPSCIEELFKHMCLFKKKAQKTVESPTGSPKHGILKPQGEHQANDKKIKFEDDNMQEDGENLFVTTVEFVEQLEEFFQVKQSVVLLDLYELSNLTRPTELSEQESVIEPNTDPAE